MSKLNDIYCTIVVGLRGEIIEDRPTRMNINHFTRHGYQINYNAKTSLNMTNKGGSVSLLKKSTGLLKGKQFFNAVNCYSSTTSFIDFSTITKPPNPREFGNMCTAARADYYRKRMFILGD
jgi:hypothetical protein